MKKYYIETYGCQMNEADSEVVQGILENEELTRTNSLEEADVILLNTCSVREKPEQKIYSRLGRINKILPKENNPKIGVIGCMAQNLKGEIFKKNNQVNFVLGPDSYRKLPEIIKTHKKHIAYTDLSETEVYDDLFPSRESGMNAWITIMRGCNKFCTYCIVPYTRGRERSKSLKSVLKEIENAANNGFIEVTLLGQNVNSYNYKGKNFTDLLSEVVKIEKIKRIRYVSPHPSDITEELLKLHKDHFPKLADHIHLPLQSGSDNILKAMNRNYTQEHFLLLARKIKEYVPDMSITTDMIVGFPGETEEDFQETLKVMNEIKFDSSFMFKYSPRPHSKAYKMKDNVSEEDKSRRLSEMIELQKKHTLFRNEELVGKEVKIIVEGFSKKSKSEMMGRTSGNKIVIFPAIDNSGEKIKVKSILNKTIIGTKGVTLFAK
ncbi:MAG: tRNA (N6-isopentenyl adenosine(37)-C2)-methylthiotransferase MiaB [Candidatus Marinimicrobia bacterium]|nr:tRNA (N6-isopentenyl adenosine(37)-C2)-methylthiotransferase MiaB [Candidatus Neomarinimicrobiota bacterium]